MFSSGGIVTEDCCLKNIWRMCHNINGQILFTDFTMFTNQMIDVSHILFVPFTCQPFLSPSNKYEKDIKLNAALLVSKLIFRRNIHALRCIHCSSQRDGVHKHESNKFHKGRRNAKAQRRQKRWRCWRFCGRKKKKGKICKPGRIFLAV